MTDKVQKIREEVKMVVNRRLNLLNGDYFDLIKEVDGFTNEIMDIINSLQKEPVSDDLEEAAKQYAKDYLFTAAPTRSLTDHFKAGAKWQKEHLWKPSDGDDLPEIDREVIALLNNGKVVFAHRPYKGKYIGKNLTTGNIETFENKTYDEGSWNQPDVKWWLDVELPKEK